MKLGRPVEITSTPLRRPTIITISSATATAGHSGQPNPPANDSTFERCVYTEMLVAFQLEQPNRRGVEITFADVTQTAFAGAAKKFHSPVGVLDINHRGVNDLFVGEGDGNFRMFSFLEREDALNLVRKPVEGRVHYADGTVEAIYRLTSGQPFYTQAICQNLVDQLNERFTRDATPAMVADVADGIANNPLPQMIFLWDELARGDLRVHAPPLVAFAGVVAVGVTRVLRANPVPELVGHDVLDVELAQRAGGGRHPVLIEQLGEDLRQKPHRPRGAGEEGIDVGPGVRLERLLEREDRVLLEARGALRILLRRRRHLRRANGQTEVGVVVPLPHALAAGEIKGFLGAVPRPMVLGDERIRAAISTQYIVAPESRTSRTTFVATSSRISGLPVVDGEHVFRVLDHLVEHGLR